MPKGIRPTQNKVRKALFDILGDIEGLSFLELFAGSGAVGIEAASRGAKEVVFVENNPNVLKVLFSNTSYILHTKYYILPREVERALICLSREKRRFDVIFLDPPYYKPKVPRPEAKIPGDSGSTAVMNSKPLSKKTLQTLDAYDILSPNGLIVTQHFKKESPPAELRILSLFRQSRYGDTLLSFYKKKES